MRSTGAFEQAAAVNSAAAAGGSGASGAGTAALHGISALGSPVALVAQTIVVIAKSSIDYRSYKQGKLSYS